MFAGVLSFFLFSGELANAAPGSSFSNFLKDFTPKLNYYLMPVIVSSVLTAHAILVRHSEREWSKLLNVQPCLSTKFDYSALNTVLSHLVIR